MAKKLVSVCITTFNESKKDIDALVTSLKKQTLKPNEIIIIDAKDYNNCSRSVGRNLAIKKAKNEIIAVTDVGCIVDRYWLREISKTFERGNVDVVAGGYKMKYKNLFNKAVSKFLGVSYENINNNFLPSARSLAFTKTIWKKVGGFPENIEDTAEDTILNLLFLKAGAKFKVNKKAFVYWNLNLNIKTFSKKIYLYALGDLKSGIWWHPKMKLKTHNLKVISILLRYFLAFVFLTLSIQLFLLYAILYALYAFSKAGLWGIVLQLSSDVAIIKALLIYGLYKISSLWPKLDGDASRGN